MFRVRKGIRYRRRFGKTLNMDMLRVYFENVDEDTSKYFKDKNIWFVSISCDNDKKKWIEMVKGDKLGGIQLHMGDDWSFMEAFGNRKIPRFILVDRKGKIISPKTTRPSEPETETMLKALKGL